MTTIYNYSDSGEFTHASEARQNPVRKDDIILPRNATTIKPPVTGENEVCIYEDGAWAKKPDFRGTVYFLDDGSRHEITETGTLKPEGALDEAPKANPAPELFAPLTRFQFEMILELLGITQAQVFALIDGLDWTDMQKLVARKKVETGGNDGRWSRENPLWDILGPSLGVSKEQIDEKWKEAQAL